MGFSKPKIRVASPPVAEPPVVTGANEDDVENGVQQEAAHRKGLLSTLLSRRQLSPTAGSAANNKLG